MCEDSKCTCPSINPGAIDPAAHVVGLSRLLEAAARMHAGDHRSDDADIGLAQFQCRDVDDTPAGQEQIERLFALRRRDRPTRGCRSMASVIGSLHADYSALMLAALTMTRILLDFLRQKGGKFRRTVADDAQVDLRQLGLHVRLFGEGRDRLVNPVDDGRVGLGRREQAVPDRDVDVLQVRLLAKRRQVGRQRANAPAR